MDEIGSSHIATADLVICAVAFVLIMYLGRLPRNSFWSRALAFLCGCSIFGIIAFLILAGNLNKGAVFELAWIAFALCLSLGKWDAAKVKTSVASDVSPSDLPN